MLILEYESETESDDSGHEPVVKCCLESVVLQGENEYQLTFQLHTDLKNKEFMYHFMVSDGVEVYPEEEIKKHEFVFTPLEFNQRHSKRIELFQKHYKKKAKRNHRKRSRTNSQRRNLKSGDRLPVIISGSGLFKIFILWPSTRENVFQQGYALVRDSFSKEFQDVTLSSVSRHTIHSPELIFTVEKINSFGNKMQRSLVLSLQGIKNYRENGKCSSITRWGDIKSAVDKIDNSVHILQNDGKLRVYESPLSEFMALCLRTYHRRVESRKSRLKKFGA